MSAKNILRTMVKPQKNHRPADARRIVLDCSKRANVGHIGSALSVVDILYALHFQCMHLPSPRHPKRDRFVLSKGHAALALFAMHRLMGWLSDTDLQSFCRDNTLLAVHPEQEMEGVEFSTGSLGQGLSYAAGMALAARLKEERHRVYALCSDAELNEGSTWEAMLFGAQHKLDNLCVIIDANGQQAFGKTRDVMNTEPLVRRLESFGWNTREVNGHDLEELHEAVNPQNRKGGLPIAVIARTVFGKGVSFMEGEIKWHYLPMNDEQYARAVAEVGA